MPRDVGAAVRVGATVLVGILVLAIAIFLIGERQFLFSRKNRYFIEFENVSGLTAATRCSSTASPWARSRTSSCPRTPTPRCRSGSPSIAATRSASARTRRRASRPSASSATSTSRSPPARRASPPSSPAARSRRRRRPTSTSSSPRARTWSRTCRWRRLALEHPVADGARRGTAGRAGGGPRRRQDPQRHRHRHPHRPARRAGRRQAGQGIARAPALRRHPGPRPRDRGLRSSSSSPPSSTKATGCCPRWSTTPRSRTGSASSLENLETTSGELETMVTELNAGDGLLPRLMKDEALADELETELRGLLEAAQRGRREAQPRRGHRRQAAQRPGDLRRDQRHPDRHQRVPHAPLADPQPAEGGHSRALRRRAGPPGHPRRPPEPNTKP